MFDLGWPELMLIMVVALIVIGPKELPNAIRTVMSVVRKLRSAARDFQSGLDDIARESGLDDVKRDFEGLDYYDPGAALKNIADSESGALGLEDDPLEVNSILDHANRPEAPGEDGSTPETSSEAGPDEPEPSSVKPKSGDGAAS